MPMCEKQCGECGRCVGAHAQTVIDEKDADIVQLRALLEKEGMQRAGFQGDVMGLERLLADILGWAKKEQKVATDEIVKAKDPEKLERWHGRRFVLMELIEKLTGPKDIPEDPFIACQVCRAPKLCHCGHPVAMHRPRCFWIGLCGCETQLSPELVEQAAALDVKR